MSATKIYTVAHLPDSLVQKWLQHLRDFDTANPECHFEVGIDGPEASAADMIRMLRVSPSLTFSKIFERTNFRKPTDDDFK
jgi:hypothetical protein